MTDTSDDTARAFGMPDKEEPQAGRHVTLTPASTIRPRRVQWLWDQRLALGTLGHI